MFVLLQFLVVAPAFATIVGGSVTGGTAASAGGTFVKLTLPLENPFGLPDSVGEDTFQSPNLFGFDENQNIVLSAPLLVDVGSSPLPAGTTVASHYIFFDPASEQTLVGTVDFDSEVLAIITSTTNLANSDFLANTGVTYLNPDGRGIGLDESAAVSGLQQIRFEVRANSPGDYVRVLTAFSPAVPEASTVLFLGLGLAGLWAIGRRLNRSSLRGTGGGD